MKRPILFGLIFSFSPVYSAEPVLLSKKNTVTVDSKIQSINDNDKTVTSTINVRIVNGNSTIDADKAVSYGISSATPYVLIDGTPIKFRNILDDGRLVEGESKHMRYDIASGNITLTKEDVITLDKNITRAPLITYNLNSRRIIAKGNKKKRVKTLLYPNTLKK